MTARLCLPPCRLTVGSFFDQVVLHEVSVDKQSVGGVCSCFPTLHSLALQELPQVPLLVGEFLDGGEIDSVSSA